ncbi:MAG: hypothetical protein M3Z80_09085, partial [Apibacter sp.]
MRYQLLYIVILFPFLLNAQAGKNLFKIYNNNQVWFSTSNSEDKINYILDSLVNLGFYTLKVDSLNKTNKQTSIYLN